MTARTGMTEIIDELRTLAEAGTADYTAGTKTFWSDDQLQSILDRHAYVLEDQAMLMVPTRKVGGYSYTNYFIGREWIEQEPAGTSTFKITDTNGATVAAALYDVDYNIGAVTFDADQGAAVNYFVTCVSYDLNAAAAEVWQKKTSHYASAYNFSTDNHNVSREQLYIHAKEQMEYYRAMGQEAVTTIALGRPDDTC
jgi:hypothetical protein